MLVLELKNSSSFSTNRTDSFGRQAPPNSIGANEQTRLFAVRWTLSAGTILHAPRYRLRNKTYRVEFHMVAMTVVLIVNSFFLILDLLAIDLIRN